MSNLIENEEIRFTNDYPSLIKFIKGDSSKPLVVFFPGWSHLARVSYGFEGCDEKQFLAYWLVNNGYSFLAVSYPIDHAVYSGVYPEFTLTDWGEMAADISEQIISENDLKKEVIGIHWSASGQVVRPFNVACLSRGIDLIFDMAIEATPGIQVPLDRTKGLKKTDKNMISTKDFLYDLFWSELQDQFLLNSTKIMSRKQFENYFLGDIPIAIIGTDEFFESNSFTKDTTKALEDKRFFSFHEYPLVAVISGNSTSFPYHPIVDKYTWGFLTVRKVYHDYFVQRQESDNKLSDQRIRQIIPYVNDIPARLTKTIEGTHFLFVGLKGARSVAEQLVKIEVEVSKIKTDISGMLYT